jgi:hypothetical protein
VDRATTRVFAIALFVLVIVVGSAAALASGSAPDPEAPQGDQAVGVVVDVQSEGLDRVSTFTLRPSDGKLLEFSIGVLENGTEFPPGHLAEHKATSALVRVWYREQDGVLVAFRIEDAE